MMFARLRTYCILVAVGLPTLVVSCRREMASELDASRSNYSIDTLRTLQSLKKVNDYPLYVMTYYADYGSSQISGEEIGPRPETIEGKNAAGERGWQCTGFVACGNPRAPVFGRNFDWRNRGGLLLFTDPPNGYASVSMVDIYYCGYSGIPDLTSLESRTGLLRAPSIPFDGMNEKGVAVGMMAVPAVQPPYDPSKRTLQDLGVIRLVLDHAESTRHAVSLIQNYNVIMTDVPLHYFIADRSGESAVIEFVGNKMEVLYNDGKPFQISTNFVLSEALPNLLGHCWRYDFAHSTLSNKGGVLSMSEARELLSGVSQNSTMWSAVYGLSSGEVQIVPGRLYNSTYATALLMVSR
jgi:hypothetical protein